MSIILTQPTAYIYNGYRLPELTCFDIYPYVIIYQRSLYSYTAYCSTQALTIGVSSSDSTQYTLIQKGKRCDFNINTKTQTSWQAGTEQETEWTGFLTSSFGTPIWSSHKLTYPNGTVYISASNEPSALYEGHTEEDDDGIDLYSFTVGLVFGLSDDLSLIENSMFEDDDYVPPVREPVAYLYNGVELPPLPDWDKTAYPYAIITEAYLGRGYNLWVCSEVIVAHENWMDTGNTMLRFNGVTTYYRAWKIEDAEGWEEYLSGDLTDANVADGSLTSYPVLWVNFDMHNQNNALYLAASDPIPVYE